MSPIRGTQVEAYTPLISHSTHPITRLAKPKGPTIHINRPLFSMAIPRAHTFVTFNGGNPLVLAQKNDIPVVALKDILLFTGETFFTPDEHIQDVASIYMMFDVTKDNVARRLHASSFKGKSLKWYKGLPSNSIHNWDELGEKLCKYFEDKSDHLSLVVQLTTIKRAAHDFMGDFSYRFQKTQDRIPSLVKPSSNIFFLYFLRALNNHIVAMVH